VTDELGSAVGGQDPVTAMREVTEMMHELYKTMESSGFTSWQACRILGVMLAEQGGQS
jgi:hypothetical protein